MADSVDLRLYAYESGIVPTLPPNTPTSLALTPVFNTLDVSWIAPAASPTFGPAESYDLRHRVQGTTDWTTRTGIDQIVTDITNLVYSTAYEVQVRAVNVTGASAWSGSVIGTIGPAPIPGPAGAGAFAAFVLNIEHAGIPLLLNEFGNVLQLFAKWGRNEAAHLSRVLPMQMQVILDNESGRYDPGSILPRARIHLNHDGFPVAHGYVRTVRPQIDHSTGLKQTVIHAEGVLALFNKDAYELSLFTTETVRTGEVVQDALNQAGWPGARDIDAGQLRLQPAHYTSILAPRALGRLGPVLRTTEEAELGLLHEQRGDVVVFEERFHRELSSAVPVFGFGTTGLRIRPLGIVDPEDSWDNIFTVVRVGIERAVVQTDKKVYTWRKDTIDDNPLEIPANSVSSPFRINMTTELQNLANDNVKSVVQWTTALAEFETLTGDAINIGVGVTYTNRTRIATTVTVTNSNSFPVRLTKLELSARGIAVYGDFTIPDLRDQAAINLYDQRFLDLPTTVFLGAGDADKELSVPEGEALAQFLLTRYNHPQPHGRLPFDPLENAVNLSAMHTMNISDPVLVGTGTGMPPGTYHVEGGDIQLDVKRHWAEMGVRVSKRGDGTFLVNAAVDFTPDSTQWVNAAPAVTLVADTPYVIAAEVTFPAGTPVSTSDTPIMRLLVGPDTVAVWSEKDIPLGDPQDRAALRLGPGRAVMQVRRRTSSSPQLSVSRFKVFRVES